MKYTLIKRELEIIPTIDEFIFEHGLEMLVEERSTDHMLRYKAHFNSVEIMKNGMLYSAYGQGMTPDTAIDDYMSQLYGNKIALNAYKITRKEIYVPSKFKALT